MRRTHRPFTRFVVAAATVFTISGVMSAVSAGTPTTERVSVDSGSGGGRETPAVSSDASRVVFVARGSENQGVWLRDRDVGETYRLTAGDHMNPAISGDGNKVAYAEYGNPRGVFLVDATDPSNPGTPVRVDVSSDETPSDGLSDFPALDGDGDLVVFQSTATNLDSTVSLPNSGGPNKVYLRDVTAGTTEMVSVDESGTVPPGNAIKPDITPDGTYVAFASEQVLSAAAAPPEEMLADTTDTYQQVYAVERAGHSVTVASVSSEEVLGNGPAALEYGPTISDDGSMVAFESDATNLVPFDTNERTDAFVRDLDEGTTTRASERSAFSEYGPLMPVTPVRLADTRQEGGPLGPGESMTVQVAGENGVSATASAAALNVTAVSITSSSHVTVYPTGESLPPTSTLNLTAGQVDTNAVTVKLGSDGSVTVFNNAGVTDIVVDLNGYYESTTEVTATGGGMAGKIPVRLEDTRLSGIPIGPRETLVVQVAGVDGVPDTATAAALNVTVASATRSGYLTVFPTGEDRPLASNLNFVKGQVVANSVIAKLGTDGSISIYNSAGDTHVCVDIGGFWDPTSMHGGQNPVVPARLHDSRTLSAPLGPRESVDLEVVGVGGVPASGATAVVLNVTVVKPTSSGYLTVSPTGLDRPTVSNINFVPKQVQPNQVVVAVGDDGKVNIYNSRGDTHVVVDVMAWLSGVQVSEGGLGAAVTGDGSGAAYESTSSTLTADDENGVKDAFLRLLASDTTERASVAIPEGSEASGTRIDGHTGLEVPQTNGYDVAVGSTTDAIAFVSNGDLAADRPIGEEDSVEDEPGELSTEPATFMRLR